MSTIYKNQIITDLCCNLNGDISGWESNLILNNCTDWNPDLSTIENIQVIGIQNFSIYEQLKGRNINNSGEPLSDENILTEYLNTVEPTHQQIPKPNTPIFIGYIVKNGEEIRDILINATGSEINWEQVLNDNDFNDWNPVVIKQQQISISELNELQTNILGIVSKIPVNNSPSISDYDEQIQDLIDSFTGFYKFEPDNDFYMFEPEGNFYIFEQ
jgi:DNA polymerase III alpha subunit (gram-positive type)